MLLDQLNYKNSPPDWLSKNLVYLAITGSQSYGISTNNSDVDYYGIVVPPKEIIFPHLNGKVLGFGTYNDKFENWAEAHIQHENVEYDFMIFNIIKAFQLIMVGNPNQIDNLFVTDDCIEHITEVGQMIRDNRKLFLSKECLFKFIGFASGQLKRIKSGHQSVNPKKIELIKKFGYDVKEASHIPRLLNQIEQILTIGDLDLHKNNQILLEIRNGKWTIDQIEKFYENKIKYLNSLTTIAVPEKPDENAIRKLLINCIETHCGINIFKNV
jgi:predicted nucleotidyltransferase